LAQEIYYKTKGVQHPNQLQIFKTYKQTRMEKNIYTVMYFGNAKRYQDLNEEVEAYSKRHAVEQVYSKMRNEDYFPEDEFTWGGLIRDCDGNVIADANDETIEYDGGHFYAEPVMQ
jgi:hypothetical protein